MKFTFFEFIELLLNFALQPDSLLLGAQVYFSKLELPLFLGHFPNHLLLPGQQVVQ